MLLKWVTLPFWQAPTVRGCEGLEACRLHSFVMRMEPSALASLLARIGTSDPVVPQVSLSDVVDGFDLSRFGRAGKV